MKSNQQISLTLFTILFLSFFVFSCQMRAQNTSNTRKPISQNTMQNSEINKTEAEWKKVLTDEEYQVLREAGTERPFTGKYTDLKADGNYYCKACGNLLFTSDTKFHSGCGWPAFYDNAGNTAVETRMDNSFGMARVEVLCKKCHSHLGHVFEDGPTDKTGLRYCINSISLDFKSDSNTISKK